MTRSIDELLRLLDALEVQPSARVALRAALDGGDVDAALHTLGEVRRALAGGTVVRIAAVSAVAWTQERVGRAARERAEESRIARRPGSPGRSPR